MQSQAPQPGALPLARVPRSRGSVLIVDDDAANRMLLCDPLEMHGFAIHEAETGEQALEMIHLQPPDTVLLDVMMPGLTGYEVCRRLKQSPQTSAIPILMVSALSERMERRMGIAAGADDFLTKPVDLQEVILRVGHAVQLRQTLQQLEAERANAERLLLNTLPRPIAERMKRGEVNIADQHADVTVLVADLVGFTTLTTHIAPDQVVHLLNEIFSAFDVITAQHGLEKIKTIGDAYMVAGGIPLPRADHAEATAQMALDLQEEIRRFNRAYNSSIQLRIGVSTGPVVAGVIGRYKFSYDLWGDTVNLACRLESMAPPGGILVSKTTYERLKHRHRFQSGRSLSIKGRGIDTVYDLCLPED